MRRTGKHGMAALLVASMFLLMGCTGGSGVLDSVFGSGKKIVGKDIAMQEITEFYYTYSTSTDPPHYQRYHFSVKDGKHVFYHEQREGDHWPLKEKDITVSGTKELSDEEWATFFDLIKGGTVEKRKEDYGSGGSGPWLFLYWKGDRGKYQEFSFASWDAKTSFETFCVALR